uniref:Uncharacterized protein n=1 Tax=Brassica oleracea TaxID=3712 RepID=A0A3P6BWR4_BRAOL|nr:unnamed protein product [Brassica oleracea]
MELDYKKLCFPLFRNYISFALNSPVNKRLCAMANVLVLLSDLQTGRSTSTVEVRLLRFREARNIRRGGELMGIDMLLLDSQIIGELNCGSSGDVNAAEVRCSLNRLQDVLVARPSQRWRRFQCLRRELSKYGDTKTARTVMLAKVKKLIEATPLFRDKLTFPALRSTKLRTLINQRCVSFFLTMSSLAVDWQHQLCKTPRPDPDIKTLFTDHTCAVPNGPLAPSSVNPPVTTLTKPTAFPSLGAHGPFPPGTAIAAANSANWPGLPKGVSVHAWEKDLCAKVVSKQELGFMRRIMTTEATRTKKLGTGAVRISNEERMKKETSCAMWRRSDGGLSMWNWRGRSKGGFQPHSNG